MDVERPHRGEIVVDFVDEVALRNVHQQLAGTPAIRVERSEGERRSTGFKLAIPLTGIDPGLQHDREREEAELAVYERSPLVVGDLLLAVLDALIEKRLLADFLQAPDPFWVASPADDVGAPLANSFPTEGEGEGDFFRDSEEELAYKKVHGPSIWQARAEAAAQARRWIFVEGGWTVESPLLRLDEVPNAEMPEWVHLVAVWPTEETERRDALTLQGQRLMLEGATVSACLFGRADAWTDENRELRVLPLAVFDRVGGDPSYVWGADEATPTSTE